MDLLGRVREDFGIPLVGVRPTGLGADARAVLFRGETADGTAYAVTTSTAPQPGLAVADFLATRGVPRVPAPLRTGSGALAAFDAGGGADGDGTAVSVVPWVDGAGAIETGLDAAQWRGFGALLGTVHSVRPAAPLLGGPAALPVDGHDPGAQVARARSFAGRLGAAVCPRAAPGRGRPGGRAADRRGGTVTGRPGQHHPVASRCRPLGSACGTR